MPAIKIYKIPVVVDLTQLDYGVRNNNMPFRDSDFSVYKGSHNPIEFIVRNNDRRPIDLTNKTLSITIFDFHTGDLVDQKPIEIVDRVTDKANGIQLGREAMGNCWFHRSDEIGPIESRDGYIPWLDDGWQTRAQRMERGFDAICNYRYKYSDADDTFQLKPHHDWASNGADAYLQFAQGYRQDTPEAVIEDQPRARGYYRG